VKLDLETALTRRFVPAPSKKKKKMTQSAMLVRLVALYVGGGYRCFKK